jgi:murein DD-endopeptidase MepM/ murein hydrolase activator NlpD
MARSARINWLLRVLVGTAGMVTGVALGFGAMRVLKVAAMPTTTLNGTLTLGEQNGASAASDARRSRSARPTRARKPSTLPDTLPPLVPRYAWPPEPESPPHVDAGRFADALELLCRERGAAGFVRDVIAPALLEQAIAFSADPFLIAALVSRRGCRDRADGGFTGLAPEIYADSIREGQYRFAAFDGERFESVSLDVSAFRFEPAVLRTPAGHFYFAAAFLGAWARQHRGLDVAFSQTPHRHYVAHFAWGDAVGSARQETFVLIERRRILEYYDAIEPRPPITYRGVLLASPLDGAPRLVVSGLGEARGNGTRPHRGVDYESTAGEPVRAIADGVVVFSGIDLPGTLHRVIDIDTQTDVDLEAMGHGGFYVCVEHQREPHPVKSCYMHLQRLSVRQGRVVTRGEEIGQVGSTGSSSMGPHLHFEIHVREGVVPATEVLEGLALGRPRTTFTGPTETSTP